MSDSVEITMGYQSLLTENTATELKLKKMTELMDKGEGMDKLLKDNASLTLAVADAKKSEAEAVSQLKNVKAQAGKQSDAYMKLMDDHATLSKSKTANTAESASDNQAPSAKMTQLLEENKSLKDQLQDYDFMFADSKKKKDA